MLICSRKYKTRPTLGNGYREIVFIFKLTELSKIIDVEEWQKS